MKQKSVSLLKWLFLSAFLLVIFIYVKKAIQPELHCHVQQPSFMADSGFFITFLKFPGGISKYIAGFLTQLFYYEWAGPLVIVAFGLLLMLSCYLFINTLDKSEYTHSLMYVPVILLTALLNNYYFPFAVAIRILFVLQASCLFAYLLKRKVNYLFAFALLALPVYYLAGSGSLFVFTLTAVVIIPFCSYGRNISMLYSLYAVLLTFLIDFISFKYVFIIQPENLFFSFQPDIDIYFDAFMNYKPDALFYFFCYSIPIIGLAILLKNIIQHGYDKGKESLLTKPFLKNEAVILLIIALIIAGVSILLLSMTFIKHKKNIILVDYYSYHEKWKDVTDIAKSDPLYDVFINYYYNRAIDHQGRYTELFFDYPQYYTLALYPPERPGNPALSLPISDFYFDLGYISLSQHWAHAALALMPYNPRAMKRLAVIHLIYGNYSTSRSYLKMLSKNFISREFVNRYMPYTTDTTLIAKDNLIMEKRASMPRNKVISGDFTDRLKDLLEQNRQNKRAWDHLQICNLLSYNLGSFINHMTELHQYYDQVPKIFEQAILMYILRTDVKNLYKVDVSKSSREAFAGFLKTLQTSNNDRDLARPLLGIYSNTYMYYVTYYYQLNAAPSSGENKNY
jgi:hypothetical protein